MKLTKKLMALILCILMVASVLPAGVVAAAVDAAEDETNAHVSFTDYHVEMSFDDGVYKDFGDSGFTYGGSSWPTAKEDGNQYLSRTDAAGSGYTLKGESNLTGRAFRVSYRVRMSYGKDTTEKAFNFPLVRLSPTDATGGTEVTNLLWLDVNASDETTRGAEKEAIGTLNSNSSQVMYPDTWYDIEVVYDTAGSYGFYRVTDGETVYQHTISAAAMKVVAQLVVLRGYEGFWMNADLDDFCISTDLGEIWANTPFSASNDFNSIDSSATLAAKSLSLPGFTASGSVIDTDRKYTLSSESDRGQYINYSYSSDNSYANGVTWADDNGVLNNGSFKISFDFKGRDASNASYASARGMLSLMNAGGELRVLNMASSSKDTGNATLYFGPCTLYPIASFPSKEWRKISVVAHPVGYSHAIDRDITTTLAEGTLVSTVVFDFYVDDKLVAFTRVENGSYNFYSSSSGSWKLYHGLTGGVNGTFTPDSNNGGRTPVAFWDRNADGITDEFTGFYMFHFSKGGFSFDNLSVESVDRGPVWDAIENTADAVVFQLDPTNTTRIDGALDWRWNSLAASGVNRVSTSGVMADGVYTNDNGSMDLAMTISDGYVNYLTSGKLWIEGALKVTASENESASFVFAGLDHYTGDGNVIPADLVTVSNTGAVSLLGTPVSDLTVTTETTLRVCVDNSNDTVSLYVGDAETAAATATYAFDKGAAVDATTKIFQLLVKELDVLRLVDSDTMTAEVSALKVSIESEEKAEVIGYQINAANNAMRVIVGVNSLNYDYVGIDIDIYTADNSTIDTDKPGWNEVVSDAKMDKVLTSILADGETVTASELGTHYMVVFAIEGINSSALMRVKPYTMTEDEKNHDASASYLINPKWKTETTVVDDKEVVTGAMKLTTSDVIKLPDSYAATAFIQDFEIVGDETSGLNEGTRAEGYPSARTWANLSNPNGDFCYGGEPDKDESWANGIPTFSTPFGLGYVLASDTKKITTDQSKALKDADGNLIPAARPAGRIKYAHVIPVDLTEYIGNTLYITAKLQVSEVGKLVNTGTVTVDGKTYPKTITRKVDTIDDAVPDSLTVNFDFNFMVEGSYSALTSPGFIPSYIKKGNYTVSASEEWFEITASLKVTQEMLDALDAEVGTLEETLGDGTKVQHTYPILPTLYFGAASGYISEFSIDDITCYIIPTAN